MIIPNLAIFLLATVTVAIGRYILSRKGYLVIRVLQFNFTGILLLLIIYLYANVISIARKTQRRIGNVVNRSTIVKSNTRAIKTSFLVLVTFLVCYIPITIHSFYVTFHTNTPYLRSYVIIIVELIAMSCSMLDPFVYFWRLKILRKATRKLLKTCRPLEGIQGDMEISIKRKLTVISNSKDKRDIVGKFEIEDQKTESGVDMSWQDDVSSNSD